jgi:hypothetical protein
MGPPGMRLKRRMARTESHGDFTPSNQMSWLSAKANTLSQLFQELRSRPGSKWTPSHLALCLAIEISRDEIEPVTLLMKPGSTPSIQLCYSISVKGAPSTPTSCAVQFSFACSSLKQQSTGCCWSPVGTVSRRTTLPWQQRNTCTCKRFSTQGTARGTWQPEIALFILPWVGTSHNLVTA